MKTHIHRIDVTCDRCQELSTDTHELIFSLGKKAWASDLCPKCEPVVIEYMRSLGMGGPQARKLPGLPDTAKGTAEPAKKRPVKSSVNSGKAKGQTYKGRKCRGCNTTMPTEKGRRVHNSRTGCA